MFARVMSEFVRLAWEWSQEQAARRDMALSVLKESCILWCVLDTASIFNTMRLGSKSGGRCGEGGLQGGNVVRGGCRGKWGCREGNVVRGAIGGNVVRGCRGEKCVRGMR